MSNDFLWTAIKGHYSPENEDRLTQVFVACFNHSGLFRKTVFRFFGYKYLGGARAVSQRQSNDANGRLDVVVVDENDRELFIIENKIDAVLTGKQLGRYKKAGHRNVIAIARKYPKLDANLAQYYIYRWSDFYVALEAGIQNASGSERLLGGAFLGYLRELNMSGLKKITKNQLVDACKAISIIGAPGKYQARTLSKVNPFFVFSELSRYFEYVYHEAHNDPLMRKRFGKNFRFSPYLDLATGNSDSDEFYKNPCINFQIYYSDWKGKSKKLVAVGLYYTMHPTDAKLRGFYVWREYKKGGLNVEDKLDDTIYRGGVLSAEKLSHAVISHWKKWIK